MTLSCPSFYGVRLTAIEEELLNIAAMLGTQQATVNQLEMDLEADESLDKAGQRWGLDTILDTWSEALC